MKSLLRSILVLLMAALSCAAPRALADPPQARLDPSRHAAYFDDFVVRYHVATATEPAEPGATAPGGKKPAKIHVLSISVQRQPYSFLGDTLGATVSVKARTLDHRLLDVNMREFLVRSRRLVYRGTLPFPPAPVVAFSVTVKPAADAAAFSFSFDAPPAGMPAR